MLQKFLGDRRGATAIILAVSMIPMLIACGAAVDFARVASARAQLQSAVDSAALAGVGAYQTNLDGTIAYNVANTALATSDASLTAYATVTGTVGTACTYSTASCGTTNGSNGATSLCPTTPIYCVQVTGQAVLKNSLLAFLIPSETLSVTSVAQSPGLTSGGTLSSSNFSTPITCSTCAMNVYGYAVPTDSSGNPQYGSIPSPTSGCASSSNGILQYLPTSGSGNCNYAMAGGSGGTSLNVSSSGAIGFTTAVFAGGTNTSGTGDLDTIVMTAITGTMVNNIGVPTHYVTELYVTTGSSTTYYQYGLIVATVPLYAYCPAHNLYGLIPAYPNTTSDTVPYQDSIVTFNTAWEKLGYPPTHSSNHYQLPFLGPVNTQVILGTTYKVRAICPQWPTVGTNINATTASFSPASLPAGYSPVSNTSGFPTATNVKVYSTYYPDVTYTSGGYNWPPNIAGCSPAYSLTDGGVTPLTYDPWWGWSPNNGLQFDPGGAAENPGGLPQLNCAMATVNTAGVVVNALLSSLQSGSYNNCAALIQPLGSGVTQLPNYYLMTINPGSFILGSLASNATGNASSVTGMTPVYSGGAVPTSETITGSSLLSLLPPYTVTEPPAYGRNYYLPEDTSHQCYNPQANGYTSSSSGIPTPNNNNSTAIDPVENPQLGAVLCASNPPNVYGLYFNNMDSTYGPPLYNDPLGYNDAITMFTCPAGANSGTTGPPTLYY